MLLPYLDGERTPNRPDATGSLAGLRTDVTPASSSPGPPSRASCAGCSTGSTRWPQRRRRVDGRLSLVGGGARSAAYRQVLADLAGRPVDVPASDEQVAAGACVQAAAVLTGAEPADVADVVAPGPGHRRGPRSRRRGPRPRSGARYATLRDATPA